MRHNGTGSLESSAIRPVPGKRERFLLHWPALCGVSRREKFPAVEKRSSLRQAKCSKKRSNGTGDTIPCKKKTGVSERLSEGSAKNRMKQRKETPEVTPRSSIHFFMQFFYLGGFSDNCIISVNTGVSLIVKISHL